MRLLNFPIIKITVYLILGVLFGFYINVDPYSILYITLGLLFSCIVIHFFTRQKLKQPIILGVLLLSLSFTLGTLTTSFHNQLNLENHYTKYSFHNYEELNDIKFRVREVLKPGIYYNKYVVDIIELNQNDVSGKSLLNVSQDSLQPRLKVDEIYFAKTEFKALTPPLNPHQFDYKKYLSKKYIFHQIYTGKEKILNLDKSKHTLFGYAALLREKINKSLDKYSFSENELAIINALLLGQRQDISKEIYNSYTKAGAIHILAVSGLHVGIILLLLNFLFNPLDYLKNGNYIKLILIIGILWSYAIIAGLSASVVRAVTMFSAVAIGMHLKRSTNVYNTLAISVFILLLFKPMFLFDVGFQLSYMAVISIVVIQPMLDGIFNVKDKIINFFWKILTVTLAAQFGIIPISLFYFHQFPGLFFLSNLVIIPCLSLILGMGILVILLSFFDLLPELLASSFGWIISTMNSFVGWVSNQEAFLFKDISFDLAQVIFSYIIISTIILWIKKKTIKSLLIALLAVLITQFYFMLDKYYETNDAFIVFHKSKYSIYGTKHRDSLHLYHNLNNVEDESLIRNYKVGEHIKHLKQDSIKDFYQINNRIILVIDSLGVFNTKILKPSILLFRNSPKINLNRVIDSIKPELIISDGSNYKSYQDRWEKTCEQRKIPFHQTRKKGSYQFKY